MSGVVRVLSCEEVRDLAGGFVLDALEPDEADAVRAHLAGCVDPHPEIAELAAGIPGLWETMSIVEPPATLKTRILAAAAAEPQGVAADLHLVGPADLHPEGAADRSAAVDALSRPSRRPARLTLGWVTGLAAILAIALLGAWNVALQGEVGTQRSAQEGLAAVVRAGATPGSLIAVLAAPAASGPYGPVGLAALSPGGTLTLAMRDMHPTTGGQVYQAWVIIAGSAPAPTGSFRVGDAGLGSITAASAPVAPGAVVAITLEPGPGATTPTLPILAMGTAPTPTN